VQGRGNSGGEEYFSEGDTVLSVSKKIRMGFLRKVYGILCVQLTLTALVCAFAMKATSPIKVEGFNVLSFGSFIAGSGAFAVITFVVSFIVLISLFCVRHSYPLNTILLGIWTVAMALSVATACTMAVCDPLVVTPSGVMPLSISKGAISIAGGAITCATNTEYAVAGGNAVIMAAGIAASIFLALTAYTLQSRIDFSFLGAGLFATLWVLVIWGIIMACFGTASPAMQYWYAMIGAIVFGLYIVYDTWLISAKMGPDDYIAASISLYLDIINLFLMILQLLRRD